MLSLSSVPGAIGLRGMEFLAMAPRISRTFPQEVNGRHWQAIIEDQITHDVWVPVAYTIQAGSYS